jgi:antitoxin (DNA-binding transcriptional repressor) of toxin-antitoxin stability system
MLEVDITHISIPIDQLIDQIETVDEILLIRHGKAIARLSPISQQPQPLTSRKELRETQSQTISDTLQTLQTLWQETRY